MSGSSNKVKYERINLADIDNSSSDSDDYGRLFKSNQKKRETSRNQYRKKGSRCKTAACLRGMCVLTTVLLSFLCIGSLAYYAQDVHSDISGPDNTTTVESITHDETATEASNETGTSTEQRTVDQNLTMSTAIGEVINGTTASTNKETTNVSSDNSTTSIFKEESSKSPKTTKSGELATKEIKSLETKEPTEPSETKDSTQSQESQEKSSETIMKRSLSEDSSFASSYSSSSSLLSSQDEAVGRSV